MTVSMKLNIGTTENKLEGTKNYPQYAPIFVLLKI